MNFWKSWCFFKSWAAHYFIRVCCSAVTRMHSQVSILCCWHAYMCQFSPGGEATNLFGFEVVELSFSTLYAQNIERKLFFLHHWCWLPKGMLSQQGIRHQDLELIFYLLDRHQQLLFK